MSPRAMMFTEIRRHLGDLLNRAEYAGERLIIHRRGRPCAAIVPMSDFNALLAAEEKQTGRHFED